MDGSQDPAEKQDEPVQLAPIGPPGPPASLQPTASTSSAARWMVRSSGFSYGSLDRPASERSSFGETDDVAFA